MPRTFENAKAAFGEILDVALALGGTITGEHGVGQIKRAWLASQVGATERALMDGIRRVFDPARHPQPRQSHLTRVLVAETPPEKATAHHQNT